MSTHTLFEFFILKKWLSENPKLDVKVVYEKTLHSGPISELDNTYRNNVGWMVLQKKGTEL